MQIRLRYTIGLILVIAGLAGLTVSVINQQKSSNVLYFPVSFIILGLYFFVHPKNHQPVPSESEDWSQGL